MDMFLSVADASRILGVTPQAVRLMIRRGTLPVSARTEGGIQLFRRANVEELAARRSGTSSPDRFGHAPKAEESEVAIG